MVKINMLKLMLIFMFMVLTPGLIYASLYDSNSVYGASAVREKHLIFFVHGIGGNAESFGNMPSFLPIHLTNLQSKYEFEGHVYTYPTADDKMHTTNFAIHLSEFIEQKIRKDPGNKNAKISIVAHSQGGIVTTIWFYRMKMADNRFHNHLDRINTVITLGTPFWGSKLASIASEDSHSWIWWRKQNGRGASDLISNIGRRQMSDMSFSSNTLQEFRNNLFAIAPQLKATKLSNIRFLNVTGNANMTRLTEKKLKEKSSWFKYLLPFVFGNIEYESDGAVLIPSSTLNTLYHKYDNLDYEADKNTGELNLQHFEFADRLFVKALHASDSPDDVPDLSFVPERCYSLTTCDHPVYPYVVKYFLGQEIPLVQPSVKYHNFGGFTLDINVKLPVGFEHLREKVKVFFEPECFAGKVRNSLTVYSSIGSSLEIKSNAVTLSTRYKNSVSFWYTGDLFRDGQHARVVNRQNPLPEEEKILKVVVLAPGMKARRFNVKVKPTISSYVAVDLAPISF